MSAALAIVPASGSVVHLVSACRITASGLSSNDATTYNASHIPSEDPLTYIIRCRKSGADDMKSEKFQVGTDGTWVWNGLIFPSAGTWVVTIRRSDNDAQAATLSVVVS